MFYWLVYFGITGLTCELYLESFWRGDNAKIYSFFFMLFFRDYRWLFILFILFVNFLGKFLWIFSLILLILWVLLEVCFIVNFGGLFCFRLFFFLLFLYIIQSSQEILIHLFYKCSSNNIKIQIWASL